MFFLFVKPWQSVKAILFLFGWSWSLLNLTCRIVWWTGTEMTYWYVQLIFILPTYLRKPFRILNPYWSNKLSFIYRISLFYICIVNLHIFFFNSLSVPYVQSVRPNIIFCCVCQGLVRRAKTEIYNTIQKVTVLTSVYKLTGIKFALS